MGVDPPVQFAERGFQRLRTLGRPVLATLVYAVLVRVLDRPNRAFVGLAVVALLVSLLPLMTFAPSLPVVTTGVVGVMAVMHVLAAGVIVAVLVR